MRARAHTHTHTHTHRNTGNLEALFYCFFQRFFFPSENGSSSISSALVSYFLSSVEIFACKWSLLKFKSRSGGK